MFIRTIRVYSLSHLLVLRAWTMSFPLFHFKLTAVALGSRMPINIEVRWGFCFFAFLLFHCLLIAQQARLRLRVRFWPKPRHLTRRLCSEFILYRLPCAMTVDSTGRIKRRWPAFLLSTSDDVYFFLNMKMSLGLVPPPLPECSYVVRRNFPCFRYNFWLWS